MIGIVIMSHGSLGTGIVEAAEVILGPIEQAATVSLRPGEGIEELNADFLAALEQVDTGEGVLVLTDLIGGSLCNVASMNLAEKSYQLVSGVNLPMLIEVLSLRDQASCAEELAAVGLRSGFEGVKNVNALLGL